MPRAASGPRRIDSSGTWYAVKVIKGKRHTISLGTKIKSEAYKKWPAAQAQLEALATPQKLPAGGMTTITEFDPVTGASRQVSEWNTNITQTYEEEDPSVITWKRAEEIAARRYMRRKGKEVSRSWRYQIKNALRHLAVKYPLDVKPKDVRQMVDGMEEQGYAASTIAQRCSALSGVIDALIKGGHTEDDHVNAFERVDTHGISTESFYKPTPEDYRIMWSRRELITPEAQRTLEVIMFSGVRINEAINGTYKNDHLLDIPKEIAKNKASIRVVPLPSNLTQGSTCSSIDQFRRQWDKIRSVPEITPHSFRHGFKTAAREAGADELTVERLLGHTIPKILLTYGEYPREVLQREAEKVWEVIQEWAQLSKKKSGVI